MFEVPVAKVTGIFIRNYIRAQLLDKDRTEISNFELLLYG